MLTRVKIQNFKSIGEPGVDLELKPLTFLVGPNGGGKSSILEAIALMSQHGRPIEGMFNFTDFEDLKFRGELRDIEIRIESFNPSSGAGSSAWSRFDGSERQQLPGSISDSIYRIWGEIFLIRASRIMMNDSQTYSDADWVGINGEHTQDILAKLQRTHYRSQRNKIRKWASRFGMNEVASSLVAPSEIKGSYVDDRLDSPLDISLASSGSRQILPIIVQLFWVVSDSTSLIEEPEMSLHPEAQIDVLEMFSEALKETKQIIATTHSLFILQGIGYAVIQGWLKPEQIAVYHVEKKKETGTIAKKLEISEKGYIKGWIPSFTRVERRLLREWAKTLPRE